VEEVRQKTGYELSFSKDHIFCSLGWRIQWGGFWDWQHSWTSGTGSSTVWMVWWPVCLWYGSIDLVTTSANEPCWAHTSCCPWDGISWKIHYHIWRSR
jgi:hypothetical protein